MQNSESRRTVPWVGAGPPRACSIAFLAGGARRTPNLGLCHTPPPPSARSRATRSSSSSCRSGRAATNPGPAAARTRLKAIGRPSLSVNLAVYLRDPDGNGLELMVDRPGADWPRSPDGSIAMRVAPLDLRALVTEMLA